jgi:hypothetical protein
MSAREFARTFARTALVIASAAAVLATVPGTATAAPRTEVIDRSLFDGTPERTESSLRVDGATAGPLGGHMDMTVRATDGTLPTAFGSCEPVSVSTILTVQPGRVLTVRTRGEACAHVVDGSLSVNAGFRARNVEYQGFGRCKPRLVGEGFMAAAHSQLGGQASFFVTLRRG